MQFTKRLREGIRRGRIRCSVRIWKQPHVNVGNRYQMDEGQIVVDSIVPIDLEDITDDLARESGFSRVEDLLQIAKHGSGDNVYLVRFHYLAPGAWDVPQIKGAVDETSTLLQRIRRSAPPGGRPRAASRGTARRSRRQDLSSVADKRRNEK